MDLNRKLILLDRDGVINHESPNFVKSAAEFILLPGSLEALVTLKKAGFALYILTNQSGIGRGLYDIQALNAMHAKLARHLAPFHVAIDGIYFCPHRPDAGCACRKPKPGLCEQLIRDTQRSLARVPFVGDSLRDLQAAQAAGATPVLVKSGNGQKTLTQLDTIGDVAVFSDLRAFSKYVINATSAPSQLTHHSERNV